LREYEDLLLAVKVRTHNRLNSKGSPDRKHRGERHDEVGRVDRVPPDARDTNRPRRASVPYVAAPPRIQVLRPTAWSAGSGPEPTAMQRLRSEQSRSPRVLVVERSIAACC